MDRASATAICDRVIGERGFAYSIDVDSAGLKAVAAVGGEDPEGPELWLVDLASSEGKHIETLTDWPLAAVYFAERQDEGTLSIVLVSRYENPPDRNLILVDTDSLKVTGYADAAAQTEYDHRKLDEVRPRDDFVNPDW